MRKSRPDLSPASRTVFNRFDIDRLACLWSDKRKIRTCVIPIRCDDDPADLYNYFSDKEGMYLVIFTEAPVFGKSYISGVLIRVGKEYAVLSAEDLYRESRPYVCTRYKSKITVESRKINITIPFSKITSVCHNK